MNSVKFSVFADLHHEPNAFMTNAKAKLALIHMRADNLEVDFLMHVGDFTHGPDCKRADAPSLVEQYNNFHIKSYHCLGNHDSDNTSFEQTLKCYDMSKDYYYFDVKGYRFIILNFNYYNEGDKDIPYSLGNYYSTTGSIGYMPKSQLEWLEQVILQSTGPCILFSHQSLEREDGISNRFEVLEMLDKCNAVKSNAVIMHINGHYHRDYIKKINDILFVDLNSCGGDYIANPHNHYPLRLRSKYKCIRNTLVVNEPIHAVVTISDDGIIDIDGMIGTYFMNVTLDMTRNDMVDPAGRTSSANVSSYHGNYKVK